MNRTDVNVLSQIAKKIVILIFFITIYIACDPGRIYDQSKSISDSGWHKDSVAGFIVEVDDTLQAYSFYITIRNNDNYPFRNFYMFLNTKLPNGNITRDTIELILADNEGKWLGKGFGSVKDNQIPIRKNLLFPLKGTYTFEIEQGMREEKLEGLVDIGIRVEKAD